MNTKNAEDRVKYLLGQAMVEREVLAAQLEQALAKIAELTAKPEDADAETEE